METAYDYQEKNDGNSGVFLAHIKHSFRCRKY